MDIRVLVVDDSLIFRHAVAGALSDQPGIRVVGSVRNGLKALEFLAENEADVVTLDVEMPEMDGLASLDAIDEMVRSKKLARAPGILMLSCHTRVGARQTIEALEKGAFDFVTKPSEGSEEASIARLRRDLVPRIRQFMEAGPEARKRPVQIPAARSAVTPSPAQAPGAGTKASNARVIAIGVSTGGPRALVDMLPELCRKTSLPILVVQHMPAEFTQSLADSLASRCDHAVREAKNGERVADGVVYIAPGGRHMELSATIGGAPTILLTDGPPENGCRPAADVLFRSVAKVYGPDSIAVVMTGMGSDGAASLGALKKAGARILAQDEATSVVWGMPGSAVATGFVDEVVPLMSIPDVVFSLGGAVIR